MATKPKIIVLDDDPTGSQTVHSCLLLTRWDVETLRLGLVDESPIFFVLTNTRALTPEQATAVTKEVCQNLKQAIAGSPPTPPSQGGAVSPPTPPSQGGAVSPPTPPWEGGAGSPPTPPWEGGATGGILIVSRSDSTLRGHYPIETDVIAQELGPFDAHFLVPAFFEGGRLTKDSVHYLIVNGVETPVHETEFARDSVFGYRHSYLPDYVEEKTQGKIKADAVERFLLADIRAGSLERLMQLTNNTCGVVDGETQADLNQFAADILTAASQGKRFLFRSAASILTSLANLGPQPVAADDMAQYVRQGKPGAVIVGSHVKKTTEQLGRLLQESGIVGVEIDVSHLLDDSPAQRDQLLHQILQQVRDAHNAGKTPVVYTSRQELTFNDVETRLAFGAAVSALLMDVVRGLPADIGFLISKGGITSNDVLSTGLALTAARLLGQILAGCSMVRTPVDHPLFPNLPVVLFPGNVGDADALATIYRRLTR